MLALISEHGSRQRDELSGIRVGKGVLNAIGWIPKLNGPPESVSGFV